MDAFLDELAEIYFTSPKHEKKRLKNIFNKAFRGAKRSVSIKSQNQHLEFQVHLRTLLCFGFINNLQRKHLWKMLIPTDIKLLITLYYPDVFKAPIGVNLGFGFCFSSLFDTRHLLDDFEVEPMPSETVAADIFEVSAATFGDDDVRTQNAYFWDNWSAADPNITSSNDVSFVNSLDTMNTEICEAKSVFDMFDVSGCSVTLIHGAKSAFNALGSQQETIMKFGKDTNYNNNMQIVLSKQATMQNILDKLNDCRHLFEMQTVETGIATKHIHIKCVDCGVKQVLDICVSLGKRYENVIILGHDNVTCVLLVTVTDYIVTINVL